MTAVPLGETPTLCVLCPPTRARVARPGGQTDWVCHEKLSASIFEITTRFAQLSARPGAGSMDGGRRAPGFGSRPPVNLHNAALRDPRTAPAELGETHSPLNFMLTWTKWIRLTRGQPPVGYGGSLDPVVVLDLEAQYLTTSLDWITRQHWVTTFAEQMRAVRSQLRAATGAPNPRPVGTCGKPDCGHPLFPPREGDMNIQCGGCGAVYAPLDQIEMRKATLQATQDCARCAHGPNQHSNDDAGRPCNVQWCDCKGYSQDRG